MGREYVVPINQKEIKIYDRTKNKRIKKKQMKKASIIAVRNEILKYIGKIIKEDKKVYIGGKKVNKEDK